MVLFPLNFCKEWPGVFSSMLSSSLGPHVGGSGTLIPEKLETIRIRDIVILLLKLLFNLRGSQEERRVFLNEKLHFVSSVPSLSSTNYVPHHGYEKAIFLFEKDCLFHQVLTYGKPCVIPSPWVLSCNHILLYIICRIFLVLVAFYNNFCRSYRQSVILMNPW